MRRGSDIDEVALALRAVIFDYGRVLTGPPDPAAYAELLRITGLSADRLDQFYWKDRHAYDEGKLTGLGFWRQIVRDEGLKLSESDDWRAESVGRAHVDARGPGHVGVATGASRQRGLLTAIVSNMGDSVHEHMVRELGWLSRFDVLVWSYQLGIAKPDPAIYRYALEKLGTQPAETLFIDDKAENVDAAVALGMKGIIFSDVEKLRADLVDCRPER